MGDPTVFSLLGMILVRSNTGQLMLISQQALLQTQSQTSNNTSVRCSIPPPTIKIQPVQVIL